MSLCEKFKNLKLGQPAVLCVFEYIFKMQADLTISFIFKKKKCVSDYCFVKGSLEIDDYFIEYVTHNGLDSSIHSSVKPF